MLYNGIWFANSPVVPCTKPHTHETAAVYELDEPIVGAANEFAGPCGDEVVDYLGISLASWVPWDYGMALPSKEQVGRGASWVSCEVFLPHPHWVNFSAEDAVTEHADELWACFDRAPQNPQTNPHPDFVSCFGPHRYEETGQLTLITNLDSYPPPQRLRREAAQCRDRLTAEQRMPGTGTTVLWDCKERFAAGGNLAGACYLYRPDGTMLPPRS